MIHRLLVLLLPLVLIAAGLERISAQLCSDLVAPGSPATIAPAPVLMGVFRPPRTVRV